MITLLNIVILMFVALGTWWLTGIDKTASGESKRTYHFMRSLRCGCVVVLAYIWILFLEQKSYGYGDISTLIIVPVLIGLILRSALAEIFTHGFLRLIDPSLYDDREFDPQKQWRDLDAIGNLIRRGRKTEAIQLCEELKKTGELDELTLEIALDFLGVSTERAKTIKPITQAARLREQAKFAEAEQLLGLLLQKNPADAEAAILLMRIYAQDLRQPEKASQVLRELEQQAFVSKSHIEFARRSIVEWRRPAAKEIVKWPERTTMNKIF